MRSPGKPITRLMYTLVASGTIGLFGGLNTIISPRSGLRQRTESLSIIKRSSINKVGSIELDGIKRGSATNIRTPTASNIATATVGRFSVKKFLNEFSFSGIGAGACLGSDGGCLGRSLELSDDIEMLAGDVFILKLVFRVCF